MPSRPRCPLPDDELLGGIVKNGLPEVIPGGVVVTDLRKALTFANRYDRILYGSDWPLAPMATYRRFVEAIIPKEHHEKVFRTNAEKLFFSL
jgi:predicted TIM-barrel fold metal-dependent hydrolase